MKITYYKCDICGDNVPEDSNHLNRYLNVIFLTEQNEGRATKPYLENKYMDICEGCLKKVIAGKGIYGTGAMGFNKYMFAKPK